MANISMRHLKKVYPGNIEVIPDLNLEIQDKEFIILVGPSGCGKSTTLRMIAGLEEISGGEMYIGDKLVNDVPPKDRDIAMVFQNYAIYPTMSVRDNIEFGLKNRRVPKEERDTLIGDVSEIVGLTEYLGRKPSELSGGQRQRVALARALVNRPSILLADEPTGNLDPKNSFEIMKLLEEINERGTTVLVVTHNREIVNAFKKRVITMKKGVIVSDEQEGEYLNEN